MSGHATAESLSRYLDAALPSVEGRRLADHLEGCPDCRRRLEGLRRVVDGLGRLPTAAPPEDLAARVRREIDLRRHRSLWPRLLEGGFPGARLGAPPLHLLALVLALGAIVYLFAVGVEMRGDRPTRIVPLGAERSAAGHQARTPGPPAESVQSERIYLFGGRFQRLDDVWVEDGLAERLPDSRVRLDAAAALEEPVAAVVKREIAELAALGAPLRLRVGDQVVEIVFEPTAAGGD